MRIPFITDRREWKRYQIMEAKSLADTKKMMEALSEASKNGMRN